jgi:hypothetical protein
LNGETTCASCRSQSRSGACCCSWLLLQVSDTGKGLSISTIERPDKDWAVEEAARIRASGGPEPSTDTGKLPDQAETAVGNSWSWLQCCMHVLSIVILHLHACLWESSIRCCAPRAGSDPVTDLLGPRYRPRSAIQVSRVKEGWRRRIRMQVDDMTA